MPLRHLLVAATFTLSMLLYVDRIAISTAKQSLTGDLGLTDTEFGWTLSAFALGYALFQTPAGNLGSFVTSLAFPYLLVSTGSTVPFFAIIATMNLAVAVMWTGARQERPIVGERSPAHRAIVGTPGR